MVPQIAHSEAITRATEAGKDPLNENTLNAVDVFVSEQGQNTFVYQKHLPTSGGTVTRDVENLLENDWKKAGLKANKTYTVYLSANSDDVVANGTINSVTDLLAKEVVDEDVYRHYDADKDNGTTSPTKVFVMSGKKENWQVDATKDSQTFEVELKRASAKVEVNVQFDPDFLQALVDGSTDTGDYKNMKGEIIGSPAWRYVNFGKNTTVFSDNESDVDTEILTRSNMFLGALEYDTSKKFQIVTYSYPIAWEKEKAVDKAPFILISIAYKLWDKTKNPTEENIKTTYNYYRIPICDELEIDKLERNNIYRVNATIGSFGSAATDEVVPLDLFYEVVPWTVDAADAANLMGKELGFLNVTPNEYTIYGNGTIPVELKVFKPANGTITISNPKIYYYNSSGTERVKGSYNQFPASDVTTVSDLDMEPNSATRGTITVSSKDLENHAVKYIEFTVTMKMKDTELVQAVKIKHIPLDNIQNFKGLYSTRTNSNWIRWNVKTTPNPNGYSTQRASSSTYEDDNGVFEAKIYVGGNDNPIRALYYSDRYNRIQPATTMRSLSNRQMYIIQISSTSDEYTLGKVILDGNSQSKDNVVSPAFMIASQLGATSSVEVIDDYWGNGRNYAETAIVAANHCATYMEVSDSGHEFRNWRLPTREEAGVIIKYQNDTKAQDVITFVMRGNHYWTLEGKAVSSGYYKDGYGNYHLYNDWQTRYKNTDYDSNVGGNIRCIRDLTLNDLKYLNGEMTAADRTRYENNEIQ